MFRKWQLMRAQTALQVRKLVTARSAPGREPLALAVHHVVRNLLEFRAGCSRQCAKHTRNTRCASVSGVSHNTRLLNVRIGPRDCRHELVKRNFADVAAGVHMHQLQVAYINAMMPNHVELAHVHRPDCDVVSGLCVADNGVGSELLKTARGQVQLERLEDGAIRHGVCFTGPGTYASRVAHHAHVDVRRMHVSCGDRSRELQNERARNRSLMSQIADRRS